MLFIVEKFCLGRDQPMKKSLKILIFITSIIAGIYMLLYFFPLSFKYKFLYYTDKNPNKDNVDFYGNEVMKYDEERKSRFVLETSDGIYFIYNNKLMLMSNDNIKEVYTSSSLLYGLGKIGENIYFSDDNCTYKGNADGVSKLIKYKEEIPEIRAMDNAIYSFEGDKVNKYNKNGKKIFEGHIRTGNSSYASGIGYVFIRNSHVLVNNSGKIYILKPYYYLFNKEKVEYLNISCVADKKYYLNTQAVNDNNPEYVYFENYFLDRMSDDDKETYNKNNYRLTRVNSRTHEVLATRSGQLYGDKFYFITKLYGVFSKSQKKFSKESFIVDSDSDIFICSMKPNFDIDIEGSYDYVNDETGVDFDILYNGIGKVEYIGSMQIKDGNIYFIAKKDNRSNLYRMNIESRQIEELYHFNFSKNLNFYLGNDNTYANSMYINMYASKDWNFFYIDFYGKDIDEYKTAILRLDNDGKNPVLVMNAEGEVVMKPLEASN